MPRIRQSRTRTVSYKTKTGIVFHLLDLDRNKRGVHIVHIAHAQPHVNRLHLTEMHMDLHASTGLISALMPARAGAGSVSLVCSVWY